jgi:hypothetical protein
MPGAMPARPLPLQKLRGLLFGHKLLDSLEHGFSFGQAHSQRLHGEFLPFELHHLLRLFSTIIGHAHHLDPELHRLALPYEQNRTSRSLTSCRLKRSG